LSLARTIGEVARTSASPCRAASQLSTKRTRSSATVATRLPPLGQDAAALVLDGEPDRDHDEGGADQEGEEVEPRYALAGYGARGGRGTQRV
jgi:hypothetical protein